jgi:hypothetical protein
MVNEFLVRGVGFDVECREQFHWVNVSVKVLDSEVFRSVIGFTRDEVRMLVAIILSLSLTYRFCLNHLISVSDIPFLSQSPYPCLWHSVSVSIALSLCLTFRFCLKHLIPVSDIPFLSQSPYPSLWHSVFVSITLSLSLTHIYIYISRYVSFLLSYLALSLFKSFLADTLYRDSKVSWTVSFFYFVFFCLPLYVLTVVADLYKADGGLTWNMNVIRVRWGNMGQCFLLVNIWKFG